MSTLALPAATISNFTNMNPLEQAVIGFLGTIKNEKTFRLYRHSLNLFLCWCQDKQVDPMNVVRGQIEPYLRDLERGGYESRGEWRPYSESTISVRWGVVRGFFKYATDEELILRNPTTRIETPKVDLAKQKCTFLPPVEFATLLKQAAAGSVGYGSARRVGWTSRASARAADTGSSGTSARVARRTSTFSRYRRCRPSTEPPPAGTLGRSC